MKIGSRTMFIAAPITTESMLIFVKPCAVMNGFMPSAHWTKTVPMR